MGTHRALLALVCLTLLQATTAFAQNQHQMRGRGFKPEDVYDVGDVDTVSLFNGSLTIRIPIGGTYPVGGGISYGLALVYNSYLWDYEDYHHTDNQIYQSAVPNALSNAGLGWTVTFGELVPPNTEPINDDDTRWLYVGADGARHVFYDTLHEGDVNNANVWYTRDSSYLRMKRLGGSPVQYDIEFPDGTLHTFAEFEPGRWEVVRICDRFVPPNEVTIDRSDPVDWVISDPHLPAQHIKFRSDFLDGALPRPQIDRIELTAFNGATATYLFEYEERFIERGCQDEVIGLDVPGYPETLEVPLLQAVRLPHGESYEMIDPDTNGAYYHGVCDGTGQATGRIRGMRLPTGGRVEWTYGQWAFSALNEPMRLPWRYATGVMTRTLLDLAGSAIGTWQYTNAIFPAGPYFPCDPDTGLCDLHPIETRTVVVTPSGHCSKHYFQAYPLAANALGNDNWAYGLSYTKEVADADGRFLSSETRGGFAEIPGALPWILNLDCTGTHYRSSYVNYERDLRSPDTEEDGRHQQNSNRRLKRSRTVYHQDSNRHADTDYDNFDGMGRYRQVTTGGDFDGQNERSSFTGYNPKTGTYIIDLTTDTVSGDFTMVPASGPGRGCRRGRSCRARCSRGAAVTITPPSSSARALKSGLRPRSRSSLSSSTR